MSRTRKAKVASWRDDLYHAQFHAVLSTERQLREAFKGADPHLTAAMLDDMEDRATTSAGFCMTARGHKGVFTVFIWVDSSTGAQERRESFIHEALHATEQVLGRVGLRMTEETVESFTYYQGWVLSRMRGLV